MCLNNFSDKVHHHWKLIRGMDLMLSTLQKEKFKSIRDLLQISFPSAMRYTREDKYPEHIAIKADQITKGELPVAKMCPDTLGQPLECDKQLAARCIHSFSESMSTEVEVILVAVLNYLDARQPLLYKDLVDRLRGEPGGKDFFAKRVAHRGNN